MGFSLMNFMTVLNSLEFMNLRSVALKEVSKKKSISISFEKSFSTNLFMLIYNYMA